MPHLMIMIELKRARFIYLEVNFPPLKRVHQVFIFFLRFADHLFISAESKRIFLNCCLLLKLGKLGKTR